MIETGHFDYVNVSRPFCCLICFPLPSLGFQVVFFAIQFRCPHTSRVFCVAQLHKHYFGSYTAVDNQPAIDAARAQVGRLNCLN